MKRAVVLITAFVIAGAIINVIVAWCCHLNIEKRTPDPLLRQPRASEIERWRRDAPAAFEKEPHGVVEWRRTARHTVTLTQNAVGGFLATFGDHCQIRRSGWPCPSMQYIAWVSHAKAIEVKTGVASIPPTWIWPFLERDLPLQPHWPGFIVNAIVYAAMLWLLAGGVGKARRAIRRRHGLCPACAYPIGDAAVCTECGAALRHATAARLS